MWIVGGEHHSHKPVLFTMYLLMRLTVNPARMGSKIGVIYFNKEKKILILFSVLVYYG